MPTAANKIVDMIADYGRNNKVSNSSNKKPNAGIRILLFFLFYGPYISFKTNFCSIRIISALKGFVYFIIDYEKSNTKVRTIPARVKIIPFLKILDFGMYIQKAEITKKSNEKPKKMFSQYNWIFS